jgi:hypothetical protein
MALTDAIGGVVSGLLNNGGVSAPDLSALFKTIDTAGANQREMINALPANLQQQYIEYKNANAATGAALQTGTQALTDKLKAETEALYSPNAPAVQAAIDAQKQAIYADLPGQQAAIREALAATGGFDRGTASAQLAAPVIQAGAKMSQSVANITADQLQKKQQLEVQTINTINTMDNNVLQSLFGMNKEQALTIMNSNRQDLKDQLSELVQQSQNQTNQTLGVQGAQIQNQYNADVAAKAQKDAMNNAWVNLGTNAVDTGLSAAGGWKGIAAGLGTGGTQTGYAPPSYANSSFMPSAA